MFTVWIALAVLVVELFVLLFVDVYCLRMRCVLWFGVCGLLIASVLVGYVCCGVCCGYVCMFELVW